MNRPTPTLDTISIATPCSADWAEMKGDDRSRFCSHCSLNVYNLSAMSRSEAQSFVEQAEGRVCVRFYRRADGTMLTQDCPVGVRAVQARMMRRVRSIAAAISAFVAGVIGVGGLSASEPRLMGRMAAPASQPADTASSDSSAVATPADTVSVRSIDVDPISTIIMGGMMMAPEPIMGEIAAPEQDTASAEEPASIDAMIDDDEQDDEPAAVETSIEISAADDGREAPICAKPAQRPTTSTEDLR